MKTMRNYSRMRTKSSIITLSFFFSTLLLMSSAVNSKEALDKSADFEKLMEAVAYGDKLWHTGESGKGSSALSTNGLGCANCHPDAAATQPESWPKYQTNLGKVGTMREMFNWCMQVVQQGKGFKLDSKEMIAMEAYATYMNRGAKLNPGMDKQTSPKVISGVGYPTNDEGNL